MWAGSAASRGVPLWGQPGLMKRGGDAGFRAGRRRELLAVEAIGAPSGHAGVILVLARVIERGWGAARERELLGASVETQLSHRQSGQPFLYPYEVGKTGSRLAWCYGDLGVALALRKAARALDSDDWASASSEAVRTAASASIEASLVVDAGLCHGAAGVALVFSNFTDEPLAIEAANRWWSLVARFAFTTRAVGLLEGLAGIALALESRITGSREWARLYGFA